jgi:hypothetical protein
MRRQKSSVLSLEDALELLSVCLVEVRRSEMIQVVVDDVFVVRGIGCDVSPHAVGDVIRQPAGQQVGVGNLSVSVLQAVLPNPIGEVLLSRLAMVGRYEILKFR